ncbi:CC/Se motif family (seleno)protein [Halomonas chromatireducens]|uniref:Iron-binding protein IscA n=1 Tax=Halomonas chromatireducens TaxID=507626 RepID=A0A120JWB4_9GAMM|nr:CC/Se motif family (seleno)protein [Halomonas chromatireducens]AMD01642.1 hypothetical protein LOKO_02582 [Halomonas chromatireducens]
MAIEISDNARAWIERNGGVLSVRLSSRHGCCGGGADIAVAEARTPSDLTHYRELDLDGLKLFIEPALIDQGLIVEVEGLLGLKHLFVDGSPIARRRD